MEREVAALGDLPRKALAERWRAAYGMPPAADVSEALMRKALSWEVQAMVCGGHAPKTLRALKAAAKGGGASKAGAVGSRLVRKRNRAIYEVELLESSYRWRSEIWTSLSAIATAITGAKCSGPRFFGLAKRS